MNFKKRANGSWTDTPHYIHNTSADTLTTLPAVLYPNDTTATVGLKGNMEQNGTPTPTTPIQPQECGERTRNLAYGMIRGANISPTGKIDRASNYDLAIARVEAGKVYTADTYVFAFYTDEPIIGSVSYDGSRIVTTPGSTTTFTVPITGYVVFRLGSGEQAMLNTGNTALPYEPYGIKIPISSANTTTPVYLGEVETTRKIKKLVFDGTENWIQRSGDPPNVFFIEMNSINFINNLAISTHYLNQDSGSFDDLQENHIIIRISLSGDKAFIGLRDANYPATPQGKDQLKEWLAAQYAAGTPVTVWYVLAEPTTGIVNEPLRKIGDYADTVSGITIPTIAGENTISVGTSVQPSEVTVNYKGWHPVSGVHERESGQWD